MLMKESKRIGETDPAIKNKLATMHRQDIVAGAPGTTKEVEDTKDSTLTNREETRVNTKDNILGVHGIIKENKAMKEVIKKKKVAMRTGRRMTGKPGATEEIEGMQKTTTTEVKSSKPVKATSNI